MKRRAYFAWKCDTLEDVDDFLKNDTGGEWWEYEIVKTYEVSQEEYDRFASNLTAEPPQWLNLDVITRTVEDGKVVVGAIRVVSPNRPTLVINTEGYGYARYVTIEK